MIVNYCSEGPSISDFEDIEKFVIERYLNNQDIKTSSESVVVMAQILYMEGKIDVLHAHLNGMPIKMNGEGMFQYWPEGFCDLWEILTKRLICAIDDYYRKEVAELK
jgi:hypothetical protein